MGEVLLDLNNPAKVIARTKRPILQPEEHYERIADVNNVVFPTGACVIAETYCLTLSKGFIALGNSSIISVATICKPTLL